MSRRLILAAVALSFLVGAAYFIKFEQDQDKHETNVSLSKVTEWRKFSPKSGRFELLLPSSPQYVRDLMDIPDALGKRHYELYVSEKKDGAIFMVSAITYLTGTKDQPSQSKLLEDVIKESAQKASIEKMEEGTFLGLPSSDFIISNGAVTIEGKAIINNDLIVVLSYVSNDDNRNPVDFETFINSFKFLPGKGVK